MWADILGTPVTVDVSLVSETRASSRARFGRCCRSILFYYEVVGHILAVLSVYIILLFYCGVDMPDLGGTVGLFYFIILLRSNRARFGRYCRSILFYYFIME